MAEKRFSTEEALNLLLETTDRDDSSEAGSSESDVDVLSLDPPGPKAIKIDGPDGINSDTTRRDFIQLQNVDAISLGTPSASSPSASPASTPPSSPVNIRNKSVKSKAKSANKREVRKVHADHPPKRTKKKDGGKVKVKSDAITVQRVKKNTHFSDNEPVVISSSSDNEPVVISSASDNEPIVIRSSSEHSSDSEPHARMESDIKNPSLTDSSSDNEPAVSQRKDVRINPSRHIPVTADLGGCTDFSTDNERFSDLLSSSSEIESSGSSSKAGRYMAPENFPGPPDMGKDVQKDLDQLNDSLEDFDLGETISQTVNRPNFLISKIPFRIMCMYIKRYLMSIDVDPSHPQWPVPGMDKNQKRHFRRKVERYTVKKGILYYLHKFVDKTIGYERGMY